MQATVIALPMPRFKNILFVPAAPDRTSECFDHAVGIAKASDANLTFYGAVEAQPPLQEFVRLGDPPRSVTDVMVSELTENLHANAARYKNRIGIDVHVDVGSPALEIVRRSIASHHDLVMLTTDDSESLSALARRVLRMCPCPVWVLRPRAETSRVLAAIDPDAEPALNELILELGRSLATDGSGGFHVLHAWQFHGEDELLNAQFTDVRASEVAEFATLVEAKHRQNLEQLLTSAGQEFSEHVHLVNDSPAGAIRGLIEMYRIDLLVMGSIGRTDSGGVMVGNTAEQVFGKVPTSVLVVKPPGFVSPVHQSITG